MYLAAVLDLFPRQILGWSMKSRMSTDLVMDTLLMASWNRRPKQEVLTHSDQRSQYTSREWRGFLKDHRLKPSMSRCGNCHDNAVAGSFFSLLKSERVKRKIYKDRETARQDIFDYMEMFYNSIRRHGNNSGLSSVDFEKQYFKQLSGVWDIGGLSGGMLLITEQLIQFGIECGFKGKFHELLGEGFEVFL